MSEEIIKIQDIKYIYSDGFKALDKVSFTVSEGEKFGIIGANGAGKSTILKALTGLIDLNEGNIIIDKLTLNKESLKAIRKKIGFVFQESDNQIFMNNVYDDVAFGLRTGGAKEDYIQNEIHKILSKFQIEYLKDKQIYKLSGGEKKIVSLAGIFIMKPKIILMDEPTASLDPKSRRIIINLINGLSNTMIIASHDLDMMLDTCDRIAILRNGKVIKVGKASEILMNEELLLSNDLELPLSLQKNN